MRPRTGNRSEEGKDAELEPTASNPAPSLPCAMRCYPSSSLVRFVSRMYKKLQESSSGEQQKSNLGKQVKLRQKNIFHEPLKPADSDTQTEGCRHSNPDNCASHSLPNICAFVRRDGMCLRPPRSWPKRYKLLLIKGSKQTK